MITTAAIEQFSTNWRDTGGSELANTQSFINGRTQLLGVEAPAGIGMARRLADGRYAA
jgi:hypothetical protein